MTLTIACAFTRPKMVDRFLQNLAAVDYDRKSTSLAFIVDRHSDETVEKLTAYGEGHKACQVEHNAWNTPIETDPAWRRKRIAEVKNQSREMVERLGDDLVIGLEDDTVIEIPSFARLIDPLATDQVGFVEGVQCGRWGVKMVGVWELDDIANPSKAWTLTPGQGYQEITAGGFYGYATRRSLYCAADYYWDSWQPWGADVNFGRAVRQMGYTCIVDWDTQFGHDDSGRILWPTDIIQIQFEKRDERWVRTDRGGENWTPN